MFKNIRVGVRLGLMSGLLVLLTLIMASIAFSKISSINLEWQEYQKVTLAKRNAATNSYIALGNAIHHFKNYILRGNDYDKQFISDMDAVDTGVAAFRATAKVTAEEEASLQEILEGSKSYRSDMAKLQELRAAKTVEIADLDKVVKDADKPIAAALEKLFKIISLGNETKSTAISALIQTAQGWVVVVSIVVALLAGVLAFWITRSITRPLNFAVGVANQLADGDLTARIDSSTSKDEIGMLLAAMQNMVGKLSSIITEVRGAADNLSSASEEVSATAQSMSQSSSEQAASVEETSAAMEQMSASINQNTENAKITDGIAAKAAKEATEGSESVRQTVTAMQQIAKKISIIDDIAYQTNLLALNAAIEAARAGEHGKGFAVVAAEVRKLAERSQVAAQEIGEMASSSVQLAERAGKLLDEMVPSINKTSDLVQEIAAASQEQSSGVGQINTAMSQLSQITQQNAAASEELAATAEEMSGQAEHLQHAMKFFKIENINLHQHRAAYKASSSGASQLIRMAASSHAAGTHNKAEYVRF